MKSIPRRNPICTLCLTFLLLVIAAPALASTPEFRAGAARVDITPPPGLPTAGHGPVGAVSRGHLTRLYARAIFFQDTADRTTLLLVSVESFAVPQIFRSEVQKQFEKQTRIRLPLASIVIAATHTHHGPGNYFSAAAYNNLGGPLKGHVWKLRDFLIEQIVCASVAAFRNAETSGTVSLQTRQALLPIESLRNRSPETFMLNRSANEIMKYFDERVRILGGTLEQSCAKLPGEQDGGWDIPGCPRLRAVDREMTILDVRDFRGRPIATVVFGAMHPTVAPADMPLFSSDFVGLAMRQLELNDGRLVAAFFNGAEGDISARRIDRDIRDIWNHARLMQEAIMDAADIKPIDLSSGIESRLHFAKAGEALPDEPIRLASKPKAGPAAVAGGEGDRTPLYQLGWQERVTDFRATAEHGAKLNAFESRLLPNFPDLTKLIARPRDFPAALPLGYARIGNLEIVSTPTEMSTATGYAIRKALGRGGPLIIIGLANEYASYTVTADEYPRQDYMAAATLWGPQEEAFFVSALKKLQKGLPLPEDAETIDRPGDEFPPPEPFDVGAIRHAVDEDLDLILRKNRNPVRDLPYLTWSDEGQIEDDYVEASRTSVAIKTEGGALIEDDSAGRLVILLREKPERDVRKWAAIWLAPLDDPPVTGHVFFTVTTPSGKCYNSPLFDAVKDKGERGPAVPCATTQTGSRRDTLECPTPARRAPKRSLKRGHARRE